MPKLKLSIQLHVKEQLANMCRAAAICETSRKTTVFFFDSGVIWLASLLRCTAYSIQACQASSCAACFPMRLQNSTLG
jgi:hypothetical protein